MSPFNISKIPTLVKKGKPNNSPVCLSTFVNFKTSKVSTLNCI